MRCFVLLLLSFSTAIIAPPLQSQLVQIGPSDPNFCEKAEHITPNLHVREIARISGTLVDDSGAPFKASRVELRTYISAKRQSSVKTVMTDEHGQFDLGRVEPDQYRFPALFALSANATDVGTMHSHAPAEHNAWPT
jgi:hypothetical protein